MPRVPTIQFNRGRLLEAMNLCGLTATMVAYRSGVAAGTVYNAIAGRPVGIVTARAIAKALKIHVNTLSAEPQNGRHLPAAQMQADGRAGPAGDEVANPRTRYRSPNATRDQTGSAACASNRGESRT